jgi:sulfopyruvate decarboxylase subunit alpha
MPPTGNATPEVARTTGPMLITEALQAAGINFIAGLPDRKLLGLIQLLKTTPYFQWVPVCREEEAIGICAGAFFGGHKMAVVMQNGGLLECTNSLASTAIMCEFPMLLLVYYAGDLNDRFFSTVGQVTEPILQAMGIRTFVLRDTAQIRSVITGAQVLAEDSQRPVAILLTKSVLLD